MNQIKEWLLTLNLFDEKWRTAVKNANSCKELEELACPLVAEIGWLNLEGLNALFSHKKDLS